MASAITDQLRSASTGQAQQPKNPYDALKRQLETSKAEFLPLMGGSMSNVDKFIRVVLNSVLATPDLLGADRRSLIASCMKAAQDGLMPDGREAVLNIYRTNVAKRDEKPNWVSMVQYLPMVGGLIKKLYESGEIVYIDAAVVYANDRFVFRRGDAPALEHEPTMADDAGAIVAAYCVVKMRNGETKREVLPMRDINRIKAASKSADSSSGPWNKWADQMAIKSVIKRIYKQLPKIDAFERLDASDNQAMGFAATPTSIADVAMRNAPTQTEPAIEYQPSETIDWGATQMREPEYVMADDQQQRQQRAPAAQAAQKPAATVAQSADADGVIDPPSGGFDVDAAARRIQSCADAETLDLMTDDLRMADGLSAEDFDMLTDISRRRREELATQKQPAAQPARRADTRSRSQMNLA